MISPGTPSFWLQALPLLLAYLVFYFGIIRPNRQAQMRRVRAVLACQPGDEVLTRAGMRGVVVSCEPEADTWRVDVGGGTVLSLTLDGIAAVVRPPVATASNPAE